jgi:hypothetical protein
VLACGGVRRACEKEETDSSADYADGADSGQQQTTAEREGITPIQADNRLQITPASLFRLPSAPSARIGVIPVFSAVVCF